MENRLIRQAGACMNNYDLGWSLSRTGMNIYDIYGKLVKNYILKTEAEIIDIIDLPQGMYVYRLSRNNELLQTGKLIKM